MKKVYQEPKVTVQVVAVENGFANSLEHIHNGGFISEDDFE